MCIKKSTREKMAVPLKEPQSQFHPYLLFVSQIKKYFTMDSITYQIKILAEPSVS